MKGATDKFKITIESRNPDTLPEALVEFVKYMDNMNMIKSNYEKITRELDEKIKDVKETYAKNYSIKKVIEKRLQFTISLFWGSIPLTSTKEF